MSKWGIISRDNYTERLQRLLAQFIGYGNKPFSFEDIVRLTSITNTRTVQGWINHDPKDISSHVLCELMSILPPEFTNQYLQMCGMTGAHPIDPSVEDAKRINRDLAELNYLITDASIDGRFDHQERAVIGPKALSLASSIQTLGMAFLEQR